MGTNVRVLVERARRLRARVLRGDSGQGLVEYVIIIAIVSLGAVVALGFFSGKINTLFSKTGNSLNNVTLAAGAGAPPPPPAPPNGTTLTNGNTTSSSNALPFSDYYGASQVQVCSPNSGLNALLCLINPNSATWATVTMPGLYSLVPRSGACSFTYNNGYTFSGTWSSVNQYRVGTSGGVDYTFACL